MGERHKQNMKADCRTNSNSRKNDYRNYANGPVWDHHRNEEYDRYKYYDQQQYNYRQGVNERRDLTTVCYPPAYRHVNSAQDMWSNPGIDGKNGTSSYYNNTGKYDRDHRNSNYTHHQQIYPPPPQYDYVAVATVAPIQQANGIWQQQNRFSHNKKRRQELDDSVSYNHKFMENNHKPKKKKPLSQNVPTKREWTIDDAKKAINVEMEFSKRFKQNSLMIKFPDIDINKEIVSKFHNAIENVHFQQPSTARYCFVTLDDHADGDLVIKELNATKFGQGFLTAEYKKERDNQIVSPEDIDPLTLYVGNLAQEITKQDLEQIYTKKKRIDIGFAMKMKKTRYAFISFWNVEDSIESYTRTRSDVLYSKSLIVRFRRLHGTVGLPGEPKLQNPPKSTIINHIEQHNEDANSSGDERSSSVNPKSLADRSDYVEEDSVDTNCEENLGSISQSGLQLEPKISPNLEEIDSIHDINSPRMEVDLSLVKQEQPDDIIHDKEANVGERDLQPEKELNPDIKPIIHQLESPFLPSSVINELMIQHTPIKEELSVFESVVAPIDVLTDKNEQNSGQGLQNDCNNSENAFLEFEMDMVSNVDFNNIYKSIQPNPGS